MIPKKPKLPPHPTSIYISPHLKWTERPSESFIHRSMPFNQVFSWACCSSGKPGLYTDTILIYESLTSTPRRAARVNSKFLNTKYYSSTTRCQHLFFLTQYFQDAIIYSMIYLWFWPIFHTIKTNISLVNFGSRPELTAMTHRQRLQVGKRNCSRTAPGLEDHPRTCKSLA